MPQYSTFRYGRIAKYGRYKLTGTGRAIGPHVVYRMRTISPSSKYSEYLTMSKERVVLPPVGQVNKARVRINTNEWVYMQTDTIPKETYKVRIRSIESDGGMSEWVYGERAIMTSQ